ncbi:metalloendopeptidase OMA1, mitochondrial-like [Rhopalosiphum padi]|uniref:metalloendopeptidase OMA1, mitochondrial-like n=1 Tax=Rhopalosiphum padi TaxID=40932 RepID=UPI00298DB83C|nr:metalloendopeptidase OMA1, mitochondrial-like [Rhopalosiphum padi]
MFCSNAFRRLCVQTRSLHVLPYGKVNRFPYTRHMPFAVHKHRFPPVVYNGSNRLQSCERYFSVSPVNRLPFPPIAAIVLRPVAKFFAMMLGIRIRRWWTKLSAKEKKQFWYNVHRRRKQITAGIASVIGLFLLYCAAHMEFDPMTGKRRLILFTHQQMVELANSIANELLSENQQSVLSTSHPLYKRAMSIAMQVINANKPYDRLQNRTWSLIVVNDPRINAMVLPNGMIIVFSGLLYASNDQQVGVVLSHEIAHCFLDHHAVRLSREQLLEMLWLIPLTVMWAVFPVPEAILGYLFGHYFKSIVMLLPYERDQEIEADKYGLMLAANACIDVRQAPIFWKRMEKLDPNNNDTWWLSTHPSHSKRVKYIEDLVPYALQLRQQNGCPSLDRSYWSRFSLF